MINLTPIEKWQNEFETLFSVIVNTMPPGNNHKISNDDYLEILSYILDRNNVKDFNLANIVNIKEEEVSPEIVEEVDPLTEALQRAEAAEKETAWFAW